MAAPADDGGPDGDDDGFDMPRPKCPRCGEPAKVNRKLRVNLGLGREPVLMVKCPGCRLLAAAVPGIADIWREDGPGVVDRLLDDACEGLRLRAFLAAEPGDPGLGAWGWS